MASVLEKSDVDALESPPFPVRRWTVSEYRQLAGSGLLQDAERLELVEGWIVPKMTHNPPHVWAVSRMERMLKPLLGSGSYIRIQVPITTRDSEPEPDVAVVAGNENDYLHKHPSTGDIALVVEVADASLNKDRRKAKIYAEAGIPHYWIVNLLAGVIECFTDPDPAARLYRSTTVREKGDDLPLSLPGGAPATLSVSDLLPPTG
jgi:Uma2 family endonuclease